MFDLATDCSIELPILILTLSPYQGDVSMDRTGLSLTQAILIWIKLEPWALVHRTGLDLVVKRARTPARPE